MVRSYVATALADYQERESLAELDQAGLTGRGRRSGRRAGESRSWPHCRSQRADPGYRALLALDHPAKALLMQARLEQARRREGRSASRPG